MGLKEHGSESASSCFSKLLSAFVRHIWNSSEVVCFFFCFWFNLTFFTPYEFNSTCSSTKGLDCRIMSMYFFRCTGWCVTYQNGNTLSQLVVFLFGAGVASEAFNQHALILFLQHIYLKLHLHRQVVYTDCTLTLPASCLVFSYFLLCLFFLWVWALLLTLQINFDLWDRRAANCAAAILTSLRGDLISSEVHFFSFLPPLSFFLQAEELSVKGAYSAWLSCICGGQLWFSSGC